MPQFVFVLLHLSNTMSNCGSVAIEVEVFTAKKMASANRPVYCVKCDKLFVTECALVQHTEDKHGGVTGIECSECKQQFPDSWHLDDHRRLRHNQVGEDVTVDLPRKKFFLCDECGKFYSSKGSLYTHKYWYHARPAGQRGGERSCSCTCCHHV